MSIFLKLHYMNINDKEFWSLTEQMINENFERLSSVALIKFTIFYGFRGNLNNASQVESLLKRVKGLNPESINEFK